MNGKSHFAAVAFVAILAGSTGSSASESGSGSGASGGEGAQSHGHQLQLTIEGARRDLDRIDQRGRVAPRGAQPASSPPPTSPGTTSAPAPAAGIRGAMTPTRGELKVAGGTVFVPGSYSDTTSPQPFAPPAGWKQRFTAQDGRKYYLYGNGEIYVVTPDGMLIQYR